MDDLNNIILNKINNKDIFKKLGLQQNKRIGQSLVLFGAGQHAHYVLNGLRDAGIEPNFFCDNNPQKNGTLFEGVPVISYPVLLEKHKNSIIIITSLDYKTEIATQLKHDGLAWVDNDIIYLMEVYKDIYNKAFNLFEEELSKRVFYERILHCITEDPKWLIPIRSQSTQYFEKDIIKLFNDEIFIDGGAFTGDTVEEFLRQTDGKFDKIYSFEPEVSKHVDFYKVAGDSDRIKLLPYGLWSKDTLLQFDSRNTAGSMISDSGDTTIQVTSIDKTLNGKPATFIKLDIQGAELEALEGARETITKYKPKLAICVYHKTLDIVKIPIFLKSIVPQYKLYLRHYGDTVLETVLYAVADQVI
ncbi:MAG: FkbM family methyltransferase [Lutisporaceae bacterium]